MITYSGKTTESWSYHSVNGNIIVLY